MAAIQLHWAHFSDSYIKNHLCWKSDTFLMYLCNTFYIADQHTKAITLGLNPLTIICLVPSSPKNMPSAHAMFKHKQCPAHTFINM